MDSTMSDDDTRVDLLRSSDANQRTQTIAAFVTKGDQQAVAGLAAALMASHWPACDELADALAKIGTDEARQSLIRALKGRRHHIRSAAVKALSRLGDRSVRTAIAGLAKDPAYEVRQDVAEALGRIDSYD